jgi:hypothetical protein
LISLSLDAPADSIPRKTLFDLGILHV